MPDRTDAGEAAVIRRLSTLVCPHNAGRSQMSAALFERAARGGHEALSAGSEANPSGRVHPQVVEVMRELGIDLSDRRPQHSARSSPRRPK